MVCVPLGVRGIRPEAFLGLSAMNSNRRLVRISFVGLCSYVCVRLRGVAVPCRAVPRNASVRGFVHARLRRFFLTKVFLVQGPHACHQSCGHRRPLMTGALVLQELRLEPSLRPKAQNRYTQGESRIQRMLTEPKASGNVEHGSRIL